MYTKGLGIMSLMLVTRYDNTRSFLDPNQDHKKLYLSKQVFRPASQSLQLVSIKNSGAEFSVKHIPLLAPSMPNSMDPKTRYGNGLRREQLAASLDQSVAG